jgi:hypothetical protein
MNKLKELFIETEPVEAIYVGSNWALPENSLIDRFLSHFGLLKYIKFL